jgi:amidase
LTPASKGNIVGIKPSLGLTSRDLVIPITIHQDTVGPLARTVRDAATVLSVIAGIDKHDNITSAIPNDGKLPDYVAATTKYKNLTGVRIGVARNGIETDLLYGNVNRSYILSAFESSLSVLRDLGAEIVDPADFFPTTHDEFDLSLSSPEMNNQSIACAAGFMSGLAAYASELTHNPHNIRSVADLRRYTIHDAREDYPNRNVGIWDGALALGYNDSDIRAFKAWQASLDLDREGGVTAVCDKMNLSALVIPTEYSPTWASAPGLPAVSVPLGAYPDDVPIQKGLRELIAVAPGIPFGLTFLGKRWSEETLIGLAAVYERATKFRESYVLGPNATIPKTEISDIINKTSEDKPSTGNRVAFKLPFAFATVAIVSFQIICC